MKILYRTFSVKYNNYQMNTTQRLKPSKGSNAKKILAEALDMDKGKMLNSIVHGSRDVLSKPATKYLEHLVDPKRAKAARPVYPDAGYAGKTQLVPLKATGSVTVGSGGVGMLIIAPDVCGPQSDFPIALTTTSANTLTFSSPTPVATAVGVVGITQGGAPYSGGYRYGSLNFRTVACGAYLWPTGSATDQSGSLYMLEFPGHTADIDPAGTMSVSQILSHMETRAVKGIQLGDPTVENVVNWHPQPATNAVSTGNTGSYDQLKPDFQFKALPSWAATSRIDNPGMVVVVTGAAGTQWSFDIYATYECRGLQAEVSKPQYYDSRGWDLILNGLAQKSISGWVGTPHEALASYQHSIVREAHKAEDLPEEVDKKLPSGGKNNTSVWNDLFHMAKEVAGFGAALL